MKKLYQIISEFFIVKWLTLAGIKLFFIGGRLLSHLRFKALVPNSGQSVCHWTVELKYGKNIVIGDHTSVAQYACIGAKSPITIGDYVRISRGVVIETAGLDLSKEPPYKHISKPIVIEDGVWIASNAIILPGVTIGKNSIIGAGAVIPKDVPEGSIIVGQPFRNLSNRTKK
jgi:acetyltransferase-like isoleucine patch superfamily enzyme